MVDCKGFWRAASPCIGNERTEEFVTTQYPSLTGRACPRGDAQPTSFWTAPRRRVACVPIVDMIASQYEPAVQKRTAKCGGRQISSDYEAPFAENHEESTNFESFWDATYGNRAEETRGEDSSESEKESDVPTHPCSRKEGSNNVGNQVATLAVFVTVAAIIKVWSTFKSLRM